MDREPVPRTPLDAGYGDLVGAAGVPTQVQPKLTVGPAGDRYEEEADRVAMSVMRRIQAAPLQTTGAVQRLPESWGSQGEPAGVDLDAGVEQARGGGQSLPGDVREPMEQAFGADFNAVRIHNDGESDRLNRSIGAAAFTVGRDVFFRREAYDSKSTTGQALLAHELTHVLQQGAAGARRNEAATLRARLPSAQRSLESARALGQPPEVVERSPAGRIHRCSCCKTPVQDNAPSVPSAPPQQVASSQEPAQTPQIQMPALALDIEEPPATALPKLLGREGYKKDRNYMSIGEVSAHVGWKAHVGARPGDMIDFATNIGGILRARGLSHKFEITNNPSSKFLTIYTPDSEEIWGKLIAELEPMLEQYGPVLASPDVMQIGATGKVGMRFGQNTSLTPKMAATVGVTPAGKKLGQYDVYEGDNIAGNGLPLLCIQDTMFFSKTQDAPAQTSPQYIYMAMLFQGRVVPDKREEANPAGADLPPGVNQYVQFI